MTEVSADIARAPPTRPGAFRWFIDTVSFYGILIVMAAIFLSWSLTSALIAPVWPKRSGARIGRAGIRYGFRLFLFLMDRTGIGRADLDALDSLAKDRGIVIVANHPALLDILLLASRLPNTVCIVKASLFRNPMLGGAKLAGYIRNDAPLPLIRRAAAALRAGTNLLIFPEGTRSQGGQLGAFRPGFALIARAAGAPVQTVFIDSNTRYLSKGWPLWRRPTFPLRYRVRLGPRLRVEGRAETFSETLRRQFPSHSVDLDAA